MFGEGDSDLKTCMLLILNDLFILRRLESDYINSNRINNLQRIRSSESSGNARNPWLEVQNRYSERGLYTGCGGTEPASGASVGGLDPVLEHGRFSAPYEVRIEVSNQTSGRLVIADAVRWQLVDEDR